MRASPFARLALVSLLGVIAVPASAREESLRQWLDGPIRYLITPDEIKEFKAQKTDADRVSFVERFWRRRDPTPDTLVNEYRQMFWTRVHDANEKFMDSSAPGWKTDRGKIYILYGPPEEIKEDPNARVSDEMSDASGLIRWVYLKPGNRRDVDPIVYVPFVRDVTGEYHLSYDPALSSPFFNWASIDDKRTAGLDSFLTQSQTSKDPLGVRLDLGKLQEVPTQEKFLLDSVETVETFAYEPLPLAIDRFEHEGGGTLAVVTVSIPGPADVAPPALLARFTPRGTAAKSHLLGEGSFRLEGDGAARVAQGRVALETGVWDVTVLAVDPSSGVSRIFKGRLNPLPTGTALALSDVVFARSLAPLPYATQASYDAPYLIGGFRVLPRPTQTLPRGEPLKIFYEIYGGTAPYHAVYQLEGQENDGRWRELGHPQEREATTRGQGFELPTSGSWPIGAYRLRIRVTDAAGAAVDAVARWTMVATDATPRAEAPAPVLQQP